MGASRSKKVLATAITNDHNISHSQNVQSASNMDKVYINRNELLVFGYIKQVIAPELQHDIIIPNSIVNLCHLFYNQFKLYILFMHFDNISKQNGLCLIQPHQNYNSINLNIKSIGKTFDYAPNDKPLEDLEWGYTNSNATFIYQRLNNKSGTCFISDANTLISKNDINYYKLKECNIKHASAFIKCGGYFAYGGIGGELTTYSSAIIFNPYIYSHTSDYNAFEYVLPQTPFIKGCSLLYSDRNNSVISHFYGQNDCLYELKLNDNELKWCKTIKLSSNFVDKSIPHWSAATVRMKCIENETLFMSTGVYSHGVFLKAYKFETDEWIDLKRFIDKHHYVQSANYYYDRDRQSLYCSMWINRNTVFECNQFNLYKNKWYKLPDLSHEGKNAVFWMNECESNNILNVLLRPNWGETVVAQYLDLRVESLRWENATAMQNMLSSFSKDECFVYN
eukprot:170067_1